MNIKTNNMEYIKVEGVELIWSSTNDRYIYIKKRGNEIIELNFVQGDDFELFKSQYCVNDEDLTNFYLATQRYLRGESELDRINQAIWAHFEYKQSIADSKYL